MAIMNAQGIMELIPNRYPICYIDYVDELVPEEKITATKNVTINESFFRGHFPNNSVMPGVLIIETLAQAASILILKSPHFYPNPFSRRAESALPRPLQMPDAQRSA